MDRSDREATHLGTCPDCDGRIPRRNLLISYESRDGRVRLFAECPDCEVPVHPR